MDIASIDKPNGIADFRSWGTFENITIRPRINRGYIQIAPGLFEKFVPKQPAHNSSGRFELPAGLELTGINNFKSTEPDFDRSSGLSVNNTAQPSQNSQGWYRVAALAIVSLGLMASFYFLRQNRPQPATTPSQAEQSRWLSAWSIA